MSRTVGNKAAKNEVLIHEDTLLLPNKKEYFFIFFTNLN
jgi:hypothetical protein